MTSANTVHYTIRDYSGKIVGEHSWNFYCKTRWEELLRFSPPENFEIQQWGYDEEEEYWEEEPRNLREFLLATKTIK